MTEGRFRRWFEDFRRGGQILGDRPLEVDRPTAPGRWPLYDKVEFVANNLGVAPATVGYILEDHGDAYEIQAWAPDGTEIWLGPVRDEFLIFRGP